MGVRHLTAKGDYMVSFDLQDGFYALGIAPSDRDYFTVVNIRATLYRLCGLPMGWSLSPYNFTTFTMTFVKHLRSPTTPAAPGNVPRSGRWDARRAVEGSAHLTIHRRFSCRSPRRSRRRWSSTSASPTC
eukprot:jgi/Tetstr1/455206/TSEL_042055.t1